MRRSVLVILEEVVKLLNKEDELSISRITYKLRTHRKTIIRILDVLVNISVLKERKEGNSKTSTRFFSLVKK